jgi:hypothetical protein
MKAPDNQSYNLRLGMIFLVLFLLFNFPLLTIFNQAKLWNGIPMLYIYVFGSWLVMIGLTIIAVEKFSKSEQNSKNKIHK